MKFVVNSIKRLTRCTTIFLKMTQTLKDLKELFEIHRFFANLLSKSMKISENL